LNSDKSARRTGVRSGDDRLRRRSGRPSAEQILLRAYFHATSLQTLPAEIRFAPLRPHARSAPNSIGLQQCHAVRSCCKQRLLPQICSLTTGNLSPGRAMTGIAVGSLVTPFTAMPCSVTAVKRSVSLISSPLLFTTTILAGGPAAWTRSSRHVQQHSAAICCEDKEGTTTSNKSTHCRMERLSHATLQYDEAGTRAVIYSSLTTRRDCVRVHCGQPAGVGNLPIAGDEESG
jgi:hypothetical protein